MKKAGLAALAIIAGALGMGDTVQVLQKQAATKPENETVEIKTSRDTEGGGYDFRAVSRPKWGIPFYTQLQYKRTKWGKVTVKKIS